MIDACNYGLRSFFNHVNMSSNEHLYCILPLYQCIFNPSIYSMFYLECSNG